MIRSANGIPPLATQTVTEKHTRQRRILSYAFSERALKEQEYILKQYTDLLVTKLKEQVTTAGKNSTTLDITRWYNFTTFDTIGDLLFNDPFHSLETSEDHAWVSAIFSGLKAGVLLTACAFFPPSDAIVQWLLPKSVKELIKRHGEWSHNKISHRIKSETRRPDFMTYILKNNEDKEQMTMEEIDSTGAFLILAGSETSATTSSSSTFFFLKYPNVYERLTREVREAFTSFDDITVSSSAQLPYLHAVIWEALRLHPTGPVSVPRIVDRPDVVICGQSVPPGVREHALTTQDKDDC